MEEKDWKLLQILYEEKNITKASERLYISQPALTYRIQQIEKEFGTKIILRGKKGVEFTPQGEYIYAYSKDMLMELRKAKEKILNMSDKVQGVLRLGVSSNYARYELPQLLKEFLNLYPNIEINVRTGWSSEIIQTVYKEEVHIGIVRGELDWKESRHLIKEEPVCVVSKYEINLDEIPNLKRINYKTDTSLKNPIEKWWHQRFSKPPLTSMEVDRIETCKELILNGLGYAIFPSICLQEGDQLHTHDLILQDGNQLLRKTWLIYRDISLELSPIKAFVNFMKEKT